MQVNGIDHVNILARDLDETAAFYTAVMGLVRTENPAIAATAKGCWMRDADGNPIIHLVWKDPQAARYEGYEPGGSTNGLHHVAFRCTGYEAMRARLDAMGMSYRVSDLSHLGLMQIFLADPNAVNLEFNFREG